MNRSPIRPLLLVLALIAAGSGVASRPGAEPPADKDAPPKDKDAVPAKKADDDGPGFPRLLKDFVGSPPNDYQVEFLLMTVPDPVATRFGFRFDLGNEAAERAIEAQGYVLDRYWLPWQKTDARLPETEPGTMLFRHRQERKLLVLLLIGETPTSGIHKKAFQKALAAVGSPCRPEKPIRILGPFFSGSKASLQSVLREAKGTYRVFTGSAQAVVKADFQKGCEPAVVTFQTLVYPQTALDKVLVDYLHEMAGKSERLGPVAVLHESDTAFGWQARETKSEDGNTICYIPFPRHIAEVRTAYGKQAPKEKASLPLFAPHSRLRLPADDGATPGRDVHAATAPQLTAALNEQVLLNLVTSLSAEEFRYVGLIATDTRDRIFLAALVRQYCPDVQLFTTGGDLLLAHHEYSPHLRGCLVATSYPLFTRNQSWSYPYRGGDQRLLFTHQGTQGIYNAALALLADTPEAFAKHGLDYGPPFLGVTDCTDGERRLPPVWVSVVGQNNLWPLKAVPGTRNGADEYKKRFGDGQHFNALYDPPEWKDEMKGMSEAEKEQKLQLRREAMLPTHPVLWLSLLLGLTAVCVALAYSAYDLGVRRSAPEKRGSRDWLVNLRQLWWPTRGEEVVGQNGYLFGFFLTLTVLYCFLANLCLIPMAAVLHCPFTEFHWLRSPTRWLAPLVVVAALATFASVVVGRALRLLGDNGRALRALAAPVEETTPAPTRGRRRKKRKPRPDAAPAAPLVARLLDLAPALGRIVFYGGGLTLVAVCLAAVFRPFSGLHNLEWITDELLFFERATTLTSRVSPVLPVVFLGLAGAAWCLGHLKRLDLIHCFAVPNPFPDAGSEVLRRIDALDDRLAEVLERPAWALARRPLTWVAVAAAAVVVGRLWQRALPSFEGRIFDTIGRPAAILGCGLVLATALQFLDLWRLVRKLLRQLAMLPMLPAYDRLPDRVASLFGRYLDAARPRLSHLAVPVHQAELLAADLPQARPPLEKALGDGALAAAGQALAQVDGGPEALRPSQIDACYQRELESEGMWYGEENIGPALSGDTQKSLSEAARACVGVLAQLWHRRPMSDAYGHPPKDGKKEDDAFRALGLTAEGAAGRWLRGAEDFVAVEAVTYLSQFFVHLRHLLTTLTGCSLLLLLAVTSYPFQPQGLLTIHIWAIVLGVGALALLFFVRTDRDEVVSRISGTTPNRVTFDRTFVGTVVSYLAPLVALLAAQIPQIGELLGALLDPILRVVQ